MSLLVLALTVVFQVGFGLVARDAQQRGQNLYWVGAINYMLATAVCLAVALAVGWPNPFPVGVFVLACGAGVSYVVSYFFLIYTMRRVGIAVPWAMVRLSVLVPVLGAMLLFGERANLLQWIGIGLTCMAFPLLAINGKSHRAEAWWIYTLMMTCLFLLTGMNQLCSKVFVEIGREGHRWFYLGVLFAVAAVGNSIPVLATGRRPTRGEWTNGLGLGAVNVMANTLVIVSLTMLPAIVVFPVFGGAGVALTVLAAVAIWREKLTRLRVLGLAMALAAVVLVNLRSTPPSPPADTPPAPTTRASHSP